MVLILNVVIVKRGPELALKVYQQPTHADYHLHFGPIITHHMKKGAIHSLISRAKVLHQDQKDCNKEIKKI
jgi:hypothetical protein